MSNYLTNTNELTDVADAIREKGGTSAALTYPAGFVSAIEAIPTGGGGDHSVEISLVNPMGAGYAANPCCILYESDGLFSELTQIGQITSPTGSATVTVGKPILTAMFFSNSYLSVGSGQAHPVYGDAAPIQLQFCLSDSMQFFVSGDDEVSISGIDYDD